MTGNTGATVWTGKHAHRLPSHRCSACGSIGQWEVVRRLAPMGGKMYPYRCLACQALTNLYEPEHPYLIPVAVVDDRDMNLLCERCGARAERMEDHHWYPRAIDEQEAEKWPRAILCQPCHTKWKNDVQTYYANGGH